MGAPGDQGAWEARIPIWPPSQVGPPLTFLRQTRQTRSGKQFFGTLPSAKGFSCPA